MSDSRCRGCSGQLPTQSTIPGYKKDGEGQFVKLGLILRHNLVLNLNSTVHYYLLHQRSAGKHYYDIHSFELKQKKWCALS